MTVISEKQDKILDRINNKSNGKPNKSKSSIKLSNHAKKNKTDKLRKYRRVSYNEIDCAYKSKTNSRLNAA